MEMWENFIYGTFAGKLSFLLYVFIMVILCCYHGLYGTISREVVLNSVYYSVFTLVFIVTDVAYLLEHNFGNYFWLWQIFVIYAIFLIRWQRGYWLKRCFLVFCLFILHLLGDCTFLSHIFQQDISLLEYQQNKLLGKPDTYNPYLWLFLQTLGQYLPEKPLHYLLYILPGYSIFQWSVPVLHVFPKDLITNTKLPELQALEIVNKHISKIKLISTPKDYEIFSASGPMFFLKEFNSQTNTWIFPEGPFLEKRITPEVQRSIEILRKEKPQMTENFLNLVNLVCAKISFSENKFLSSMETNSPFLYNIMDKESLVKFRQGIVENIVMHTCNLSSSNPNFYFTDKPLNEQLLKSKDTAKVSFNWASQVFRNKQYLEFYEKKGIPIVTGRDFSVVSEGKTIAVELKHSFALGEKEIIETEILDTFNKSKNHIDTLIYRKHIWDDNLTVEQINSFKEQILPTFSANACADKITLEIVKMSLDDLD